jgi:hypothetical protein
MIVDRGGVLGLLVVTFGIGLSIAQNACDLERAKQFTPRAEYRGMKTLLDANSKLNQHLLAHQATPSTFKACERWRTKELQALLRELFSHSAPDLVAKYSKVDGRRAQYASVAEMEADWSRLSSDDDRHVISRTRGLLIGFGLAASISRR